jgi:hypothetical protein
MAVLTTSLTRLRADFNTLAPNRDKESDGWIGDTAHAGRTSGHNPDETGGGEYEDADTKDEVRAIDVDKDLRVSGLTMLTCIKKILATPADRNRLKYIIFNRVIWSASDGWRPRAYTGSNPHDKHAHFSGDPADDENAQPWSILSLREDEMTPEQMTEIKEHINSQFRRFGHYLCANVPNSLMNPDFAPWMREEGTRTLPMVSAEIAAIGDSSELELSAADVENISDQTSDKLFSKVIENAANG